MGALGLLSLGVDMVARAEAVVGKIGPVAVEIACVTMFSGLYVGFCIEGGV